eukprot:TRINITY_DN832_c0_g1_i1.p1 TRINITY_DN832_c0_g1~~TRINITY_DN832_c0_g1_i1.p1  ORF type:complete len:176 (-),score=38.96 TRINITY_DN832_c0_g1_i1:368-895(-)
MQVCGTSCNKLFASHKGVQVSSRRTYVLRAAANNYDQVSQNRRTTIATLVGVSSSLVLSNPAFAGLFGGDIQEQYNKDTASMISQAKIAVELPRDAENREAVALATRKEINSWVARYRREDRVAGRPSYGNLYSALNAIAGHYNSFGLEAPIPKKRLDRVQKELGDAEKLLARGR